MRHHIQCHLVCRSDFNPRTPCGVRPLCAAFVAGDREFQSTHPVWGATRHPPLCSLFRTHFNPRTPCGVRPDCPAPPQGHTYFNPRTQCGVRLAGQGGDFRPLGISIHAPRVGCDLPCQKGIIPLWYFNPRTPCGVRHSGEKSASRAIRHFNPRTPCGVRRHEQASNDPTDEFQSTHPVWGATIDGFGLQRPEQISIHAPRVGCDQYGRLPRRSCPISIHAPRVGCDASGC